MAHGDNDSNGVRNRPVKSHKAFSPGFAAAKTRYFQSTGNVTDVLNTLSKEVVVYHILMTLLHTSSVPPQAFLLTLITDLAFMSHFLIDLSREAENMTFEVEENTSDSTPSMWGGSRVVEGLMMPWKPFVKSYTFEEQDKLRKTE